MSRGAGLPAGELAFLVEYGSRAKAYDLAHVLGCDVGIISRLRDLGICRLRKKGLSFAELFVAWHGRSPVDADWPPPRKNYRDAYEWQAPELTMLATLVGQIGVLEISQVLTRRLRKLTGDPAAGRNVNAVRTRINHLGLQTNDLLGGLTVKQAGKIVGSTHVVHAALQSERLRGVRVGRLWMIPHAEWARWIATRTLPPKGFVPLARFRAPLGFRSDKLSEFARAGHVPTAIRCNPGGTGVGSTKHGTWYVEEKQARRWVADRRAGRPMPWHKRPDLGNLKHTYALWTQRKHPARCETCRKIWGKAGPPATWEHYLERYPPLEHGAKRHLTRPWSDGLSIVDIVRQSSCSRRHVENAIANGMIEVSEVDGRLYATKTAVTRWIARRCPTGESIKSWVVVSTAERVYLFTRRELNGYVRKGVLKTRIETVGPNRGELMLSKHQLQRLRERTGFTHAQAARRLKVTEARLNQLLEGAVWRANGDTLPLEVVQTLEKRLKSKNGFTIAEAARSLRRTEAWVQARVDDGTVKMVRAHWDRRRTYLSERMMKRLRDLPRGRTVKPKSLGPEWLLMGEAMRVAGVCQNTVVKWSMEGDVARKQGAKGWCYQRRSLRQRARRFWKTTKFKRAKPPAWIAEERARKEGLR